MTTSNMPHLLLNAAPACLRRLPALTTCFLAAAATVAVMITPEMLFSWQLRTSLERLLWAVGALTSVLCVMVVARARWHWATKVLAFLFVSLCALALLLRMFISGMSVDAQSLGLGGPCVVQVTRTGAFGDYQDIVQRHCAVAGLWARTTPLASYRRESVAALKLVPPTVPGTQSLALTLTEYGRPPRTDVLTLPALP